MSTADEIAKLDQLHRSGALTDAEFAAAKVRVLAEVAIPTVLAPDSDSEDRVARPESDGDPRLDRTDASDGVPSRDNVLAAIQTPAHVSSRARTLIVGLVAVAAATGVAVGLLFALRNGTPNTAPILASFVPVAGSATPSELALDAAVINRRLVGLGDRDATASVRENAVVINGTGGLPLSPSALVATAELYFRPVICAAPAYAPQPTRHYVTSNIVNVVPSADKFTSAGYDSTTTQYTPPAAWQTLASFATNTPAQDNSGNVPVLVQDPNVEYGVRLLLGPAVATGDIIAGANATVLTTGQWVVSASLTGPGTAIFNAAATRYYHVPLANDLGGQGQGCPSNVACLVDAPVIEATDFSTGLQISGGSGGFTRSQASSLALVLSYGALVTPLRPGT